jgi:uncharacterized delta-60 repeat protein
VEGRLNAIAIFDTMKKNILALWMASVFATAISLLTAQAATINWGAPHTISADTDVNTAETLDRAFNFGSDTAPAAVTLNGVSFTFFGLNASASKTVGNTTLTASAGGTNGTSEVGSASAPFASLSANYQRLGANSGFGTSGGILTLTLNGLVVGRTYQLQWWVNDSRGAVGPHRQTTATAGNSIQLQHNAQAAEGGVGQFVIGTFVADATSQDIIFTGQSDGVVSASPQINGFQLRFPTPPCVPAPPNLVSWFPAEGNAHDIVSHNNGTLQNGTGFAPAEVGQGFTFNGANQYVTVPSSANLEITDKITVDVWVKPDDLSTFREIASKYDGTRSWSLGLHGQGEQPDFQAGQIQWGVQNGGTTRFADSPDPIPTGVWTHIAGTFDTTTQDVKIYVNGVDVNAILEPAAAPVDPIATDLNTPVEIGFDGGNSFSGAIDEVQIYHRALTSQEILAIYNADSAGTCHSCTPAPGGLVSWWKGEGNANDAVANNDGTLGSGVSFAPGEVAQAFQFDGSSNGLVTVPDALDLRFTSEFTLDAWINPSDLSAPRDIINRFHGTQNSYELAVFPDGHLTLFMSPDGSGNHEEVQSAPGVISTNQWQHVAATFNAGVAKLFVDGSEVASNTLSFTSAFPGAQDLWIGGGVPFLGLIDEVEVFNVALSGDEIQSIYDAGSLGKCPFSCSTPPPGLITWWTGDGNYDDVQSGLNGTPSGNVTFGTGEVRQTFQFDGTDYVSVSDAPALELDAAQGMTFDFWIKPSAFGNGSGDELIFSKAVTPGGLASYFTYLDPNGNVAIGLQGGSQTPQWTTTTGLPLNGWSHIALVYQKDRLGTGVQADMQANDMQIYVNGAAVETTYIGGNYNSSFSIDYSANHFVFGGDGDGEVGGSMSGSLDELQIFNQPLTASQVATIYNSNAAGLCRSTPIVLNTSDDGIGSLRQTIRDALPGATITVNIPTTDPGYNSSTGVYTITLTSGELSIDKNLTIDGGDATLLTISGNNASRVFEVGAGVTATLTNMTITGGRVTTPDQNGGGIKNGGTLTLTNCTISGNTADPNTASGKPRAEGGAIYNGQAASLTINNCVISNNVANGGGAIYNDGGNNGDTSTVVIKGSTLSGNASKADVNTNVCDGGGAIKNTVRDGSGVVWVINSTIASNSTDNTGGAVSNETNFSSTSVTLNVINSTLSYNVSANDGSAIYNSPADAATLQILNSTLSQNYMTNGTTGMVFSEGGAVDATVVIRSTIFNTYFTNAAGQPQQSLFFDFGGNSVTTSHNMSNDNGDGVLTGTGDQINTDPLLGALANNGGPTLTHALLVGSPALDQGKNFAVDQNNAAITADQRDLSRPVTFNSSITPAGDRSDIGAVEMAPNPVRFSALSQNVGEGDGNATITVKRTGTDAVSARVDITGGTAASSRYVFKPGSRDTAFNPGGAGADTLVRAIAIQPDGKIIVGGNLTSYNGDAAASDYVMRLNANGTRDTTFNPGGAGPDNVVLAVALQPDGKILIGGAFSSYNGDAAASNRVMRLNPDGTRDTTFNPGGVGVDSAFVNAVAVQPDGKILIGGNFTSYNGDAAASDRVMRLNPDGTRDTTFNPGGAGADLAVNAVALQPDGKILIGGNFTSYNGDAAASDRVMRLNLDGTRDTTFNPGGAGADLAVNAVTIQPDGKILIGGNFTSYNGDAAASDRVMRLNLDGTRDTTFNPGGAGADGNVNAVAVQPDGKIVIGGFFTSYNGDAAASDYIMRLNPDGTRDTTFNPGGAGADNSVFPVAVQPDGKIVIGGFFTSYNGDAAASDYITRLNGDLFVSWPASDSTDKAVQLPIVQNLIDDGDATVIFGVVPSSAGATTATPISDTLTIVDDDAAPLFTSSAPPNGTFNQAYTHTFTASGSANGSSTVTFNKTAGTFPPGLTLSSGVLSGIPTTPGTYSNIEMTASNGVSPDATQTYSITIAKADQTINFSALSNKTFGDADFTVSATGGGSGNPVTFTASGNCTSSGTNGSTTHITGAGSCTVTASQTGNSNYNAASPVDRSFSVAKADQTISFGALSNKTFGDPDFTVSATASSGLSVSFSASGNATVSGNTVHITGAGSATITASQAGNSNYNAATNVPQGFTISKAGTTTAVTSSPNPSNPGQSVTFTATVTPASGSGPTLTVTFKDGSTILGSSGLNGSGVATFSTSSLSAGTHTITATYNGDPNFNLSTGTLSGGQTVNSPTPTPSPTPTATASPTATATATATPTATPAQALNIATRLRVDTGENAMIAGFIITGNADKAIVLRGRGPSLAAFGITDPLLDPVLELHGPTGSLITRNDNWKDDQRSQIEGTIFQPSDDRESVILASLSPTLYTAILTGKDNTAGVGIVEVFDNSQGVDSQLGQISTRGLVQGGNNVMIAGFILGGSQTPTHVAIRGIGPSLTQFGINNALSDPTLELHDGNGTTIISNDDWRDDPVSAAELTARGLALSNTKESGIFTSLPAGQFTAILAGKGPASGIGVVEVYNLK